MTREEAIAELKDIRDNTMWKYRAEAIDMAISALSATNDENLQNCGDLISRADAIKEIETRLEMALPRERDEYDLGYQHGIEIAIDTIEEVPSVSAERVVRCKDCEYYNIPTQYRYTNSKLCCRSALQKVEENDFCSWAKMKGGAE